MIELKAPTDTVSVARVVLYRAQTRPRVFSGPLEGRDLTISVTPV